MKLFTWVNNHHYFDWCALMERIWRARVAKNPKMRGPSGRWPSFTASTRTTS